MNTHTDIGEKWGKEQGIPIKYFPADWKTYGKKAGYLRNKQMAEYADAALVVTNGSKGSSHMIKLAQEFKLRLFVYHI